MKRKSLFQVIKNPDKRESQDYPWITTTGGAPATRHRTKSSAMAKVSAARKKEKDLIKRFNR